MTSRIDIIGQNGNDGLHYPSDDRVVVALYRDDIRVILRLMGGESLASCTERVIAHEVVDYLREALKGGG